MNIVNELDLAIKRQEIGTTDGAYAVPYKGGTLLKATYMTNEEWKAFMQEMKTDHPSAYAEFTEGDGGELVEKDGRPPKMASYGSSSRMIYLLSRDIEGFRFEKKLPTTVGGTAHLDGFRETEDRYVFVEAKCHEPYSAKKNAVSARYKALYERINEQMMGNLSIEMRTSRCGRYLDVTYFSDGEELKCFDVKQMICHLLGIATGILGRTLERKQADFIYLLYDPTELELMPDVETEIVERYLRVCYEYNLIDFSELLRVILSFLRETCFEGAMSDEEAEDVILRSTFTLASQDFYPLLMQG